MPKLTPQILIDALKNALTEEQFKSYSYNTVRYFHVDIWDTLTVEEQDKRLISLDYVFAKLLCDNSKFVIVKSLFKREGISNKLLAAILFQSFKWNSSFDDTDLDYWNSIYVKLSS